MVKLGSLSSPETTAGMQTNTLASVSTSKFSSVVVTHNMALNLAPFGRWTLRDRAAQRRLALR